MTIPNDLEPIELSAERLVLLGNRRLAVPELVLVSHALAMAAGERAGK